ncbi:hypothetical protein L9F63_010595 [Diploptera punctata]|uniref:Cytochrome P450 n=1 Tax=Diploptera punctata TaxID=6984 RepID=A0AAD8AH79_DIPPU|nr:hypothetical protein L9F63_010595 [Diploptera punctata]
MEHFFESLHGSLSVIFIAASVLVIYVFGTRNHDYYKKRNVAYVKPYPFVGNLWPIVLNKMTQCDLILWLYNELQGHKFGGMFGFSTPALFLRDPQVIRDVCIKDFEFFTDRRPLLNEKLDPMAGKVLPSLPGDRWRRMRCVLSSAFTPSKIKEMYPNAELCTHRFVDFLLQQVDKTNSNHSLKIIPRDGGIVLEFRDLMSRFCTDVLALCTLGLQFNSCAQPDNEMYRVGQSLTNFEGRRALAVLGYLFSPRLMKMLNISMVDQKAVNFFKKLVQQLKKQGMNSKRNNVFTLLLQAQQTPGELLLPDVDDESIAAQIMLVFLAGIETLTTLLCFTSYLLATHPHIQEKLYQEIQDCGSQTPDSETLHKLQYLEMVISESMRMYPPVEVVDRKCVKTYTFSEGGFTFYEGEGLVIPIYALHRDPENFPDPDRFVPERFSDRNKHNIKPFTYLPFGTGPRNCLGMKFAKTVAKLALVKLLMKFELQVVDTTPIPLRLAKLCFNKRVEGGFWLGLRPR